MHFSQQNFTLDPTSTTTFLHTIAINVRNCTDATTLSAFQLTLYCTLCVYNTGDGGITGVIAGVVVSFIVLLGISCLVVIIVIFMLKKWKRYIYVIYTAILKCMDTLILIFL